MTRPASALASGPILAVRATTRTGLGVFTDEPIAAGALALLIEGPERVWRSETGTDAHANPNWIGIGSDRWIEAEGMARFLNHSCEPNLGFRSERELVALRHIEAGEQLTIDYATTEDEVHWAMLCACGSACCRGTIRAVQFMPAHAFNRLQAHTLSHFRLVRKRHLALAAKPLTLR